MRPLVWLFVLWAACGAAATLCYPMQLASMATDSPTQFPLNNLRARPAGSVYYTTRSSNYTFPAGTDAFAACAMQCLPDPQCVGMQITAYQPQITCFMLFGYGPTQATGSVYARCQGCEVTIPFACPALSMRGGGIFDPQIATSNCRIVTARVRDNSSAATAIVDVTLYSDTLLAAHGPITKLRPQILFDGSESDTAILGVGLAFFASTVLVVLIAVCIGAPGDGLAVAPSSVAAVARRVDGFVAEAAAPQAGVPAGQPGSA